MKITHLLVLAKLEDGTMHPCNLTGKQPRQATGYITHIQGGKIRLRSAPVTEQELTGFLDPAVARKPEVAS
jgi:hypothetical protein